MSKPSDISPVAEAIAKQTAIFNKINPSVFTAASAIQQQYEHINQAMAPLYRQKELISKVSSLNQIIKEPLAPIRDIATANQAFYQSINRVAIQNSNFFAAAKAISSLSNFAEMARIGKSISTIYRDYSSLFSSPWQPIFDNTTNRFSEGFTESALRFCNTCDPESLNAFTIDDEHSELPEFVAHSISEMTGLKSECFEQSSREGFVQTKTSIFTTIVLPILLAIITTATPLAYTIWHDRKQDLETKVYQEKMLQEERQQTIELQKQTIELQKQTKLLQEQQKQSDD